jgi:hypothetical protein
MLGWRRGLLVVSSGRILALWNRFLLDARKIGNIAIAALARNLSIGVLQAVVAIRRNRSRSPSFPTSACAIRCVMKNDAGRAGPNARSGVPGTFAVAKGFSPARRALFLGNVRRACMTNPSSSIEKGVCRRSLLKSVPMIAGAIISTNAVAQNLFAQAKLTHDAAKYQDHPNNGQQCSNCVQFVAPASCKVVEDPIGASGWCQLFVAKPA